MWRPFSCIPAPRRVEWKGRRGICLRDYTPSDDGIIFRLSTFWHPALLVKNQTLSATRRIYQHKSALRAIANCDIFYRVRVISKKPLREFANKHADAKPPLGAWLKLAEHGTFRNLTELKQTFSGVDMVPVKRNEFHVFNIGGNKYRLVAAVHFNTQMLFIRHVLTRAAYDAGGWKK